MKDEGVVQQEIQIAARHLNSHLMRNNSGAAQDETGRVVRYGLGNISKQHQDRIASSDLIGITQVKITPEMVGRTLGVFTAIEVKRENWNSEKKLDKRETAQKNFIDWVLSLGGFAGFCNNSNRVREIVNV